MYYRNMYTESNMSDMNKMENINNINSMNNGGNMITYIRFLHGSPNAPAIDVYINDKLLVKNFNYREFTDYVKLTSGTYNIKIYRSDNGKNLLYNNNFNVPGNKIFTAAVIGDFPENFELYPIEERYAGVNNINKAKVRFVNLMPNSTPVDFVIPVGNILFGNVMYKDVKDYIEMSPRNYTFEITYPNSTTNILYIPNIRLRGDRFYTIYAIGLVGDQPTPQVLIPLDGLTYLKH